MARSTVAAVLQPGAITWWQPYVGQCNQLQIEFGIEADQRQKSVPMRAQKYEKGRYRIIICSRDLGDRVCPCYCAAF
jgi:hypothetical protein